MQKPLRGGSLILEEQFNINEVFHYSTLISENGALSPNYMYENKDFISYKFKKQWNVIISSHIDKCVN